MVTEQKSSISLPPDYDYVACYLTDFCFLRCDYCLTDHHGADFTRGKGGKEQQLGADDWLDVFSRLEFPKDVVPTLQGGEPFMYRQIWEIIEKSPVKLDILTALPPVVKRDNFLALKNLGSLRRDAPYPNVRVSYHVGQNDIEELAQRVAELQDLISIGIYLVDHPAYPDEANKAREICDRHGVFFKTKEFLGCYQGKMYGCYYYPDACAGTVTRPVVHCRNTVLIISPSGDVYRCHSDLYHKREHLKVGNILEADFQIKDEEQLCNCYGLCSECDVKIKTNHYQEFGYTSVKIRFDDEPR